MKRYKYITIENIIITDKSEIFDKHYIYRIFTIKNKTQIGIIYWYKGWNQYVFSSRPDCIYNNTCLKDIIDFIENEIDKKEKKQKVNNGQ